MEASLSRTELLREIRKMRSEEAYGGWQERRLTQGQAAELLVMSERNFRRYVGRYEAALRPGSSNNRFKSWLRTI